MVGQPVGTISYINVSSFFQTRESRVNTYPTWAMPRVNIVCLSAKLISIICYRIQLFITFVGYEHITTSVL